MGNEIVPPGKAEGDFEGLVRTIGAVLNPLAQQQAGVQQKAIEADLEKFRLNNSSRERQAARSYVVSILILLIVAGVIGTFLFVGQYQLALYALTFMAGAITGAGGVKALERARH